MQQGTSSDARVIQVTETSIDEKLVFTVQKFLYYFRPFLDPGKYTSERK